MTLPFDPERRREDRDDLERLLEAALPAALSSQVTGHVDAERLAAWADHGLDPDEQLQFDVHLAACASCQELAAELARTMSDDTAAGVGTETPTVAIRRWTPVRIAKWAAPLAAAAAVVVWVGWSARALPSYRMSSEGQGIADATDASPRREPMLEQRRPELGERRGELADTTRQAELERRSVRPAVPTPAPSSPAVAPPPPPAANPPAFAAEATADRALKSAGDSVPRPVFEIVTRVVAAQGQSAGSGGAGRGGALASRTAVPEPAVVPRWRVLDGRRIERSVDAGLTWSPLDTDPPAVLLAGGSPAASICWLVGEHGLVLVSTDGERFTSTTAPADITLSSVDASTARDATVTSIDGRRFVTSDGGRTWRPLQESPAPPF